MIKKYSLVFVAFLCFILSGFGQTTVTYDFSASGAVTGLDVVSPGITLDANIGFGSFKNGGTANPALNSGQLRLYQNATKGGSIKIYASNGVTITKVVVNASVTTGPAGYTVDGGAATNLIASTTYTMSGISATSEVEFYQRDASSANRIYVNSFEVTYTSVPSHTITFNANGGTGTMSNQAINEGASANLTTNAFTRTGYTFDGWATTAAGAVAYANNASYTMGTSNVTLYAHWAINNYTVTYDGNGNTTGTAPGASNGNYNTSITLPGAGSLLKTGFVFNGWNTATNGSGTHYNAGSSYLIGSSNATLYAEWLSTSPPTINSSLTAAGNLASAFTYTITATNTPTSFNATGLPTGLTINTTTGVISGTPSVTGPYNVSISATNAYGTDTKTLVITISAAPACAPPIWEENFDYGCMDAADISTTLAFPTWSFQSDGADPLKYSATGLSYTGYASSSIGGSAQYQGGGDDDIKREIKYADNTFPAPGNPNNPNNNLFVSFLINMTGLGTSDYFVSLQDGSNNFYGRMYARSSGSGYQIGIVKFNGTIQWSSVLDHNKTYLLVLKNEFVVGTVNDVLKLWIIESGVPVSESLAGSATLQAITNDTDPAPATGSSIKNFILRQTGKENGFVDGIRVATSWESLFCGTAPVATTYTWTGASSSSWSTASNWSPNGIPSSIDNIIINSPGTNILNITDCRAVKDFTLNGTGNFTASATGVFTINGDITYGGTANAILDCDSQVFIKSALSQPIPPLTYGNLDVLGGNRVFSPTGIIKICGVFNVVPDPSTSIYTVTGSTVEYISSDSGWVMTPFTYNNLTFSGTGVFSIGYSSPAANKIVNVLGNYVQSAGSVILGETASRTATLNIEGDMTISGGNFDINKIVGSNGVINLKGDLSVSNIGQLTATNSGSKVNFIGTGDGSTEALTQTIDVKNTNSVYYTAFSINSGFTKLINQDLYLGTNSSFEVKSGAIFNFGYATDDITPLNVVRVSSPTLRSGQSFNAQGGSTLKITSPFGVSNGTSVYTGNVQIGADATKRLFNTAATYHYIGKANQISGNGLPNAITGKVIVELDTDAIVFNASGNKTFATAGTLEIRKGIVVDTSTDSFGNAASNNGNLTMSGGRYRIFKASTQPDLSGTYNLTAGVVEFAGTLSKTIRSPKSYQNIEVTGDNVGNSSGNITLNDNGTFTVKNGGIFEMSNNSIVGPTGDQTLTIESNGVFKCAIETGFYGPGVVLPTPSPAVRDNIETIVLQPGSIVNYNRAPPLIGDGSQIITRPYSGGSPIPYQNLVISGTGTKSIGDPTGIDVNQNLDVQSASLQIDNSKYIKVQQNVTLAGEIFVSPQGSLVQVDNAGTFTFTSGTAKNTLSKLTHPLQHWYDYTYWSSPLKAAQIETALFTAPANRRFKFAASAFNDDLIELNNSGSTSPGQDDIDDEGNDWVNQQTGTMTPGLGYAATHNNIAFTSGNSYQYIFEGTPAPLGGGTFNTGNISVNIYIDPLASYNNWNFIGNPYPSAISALKFFQDTSAFLEGVIYLWSQRTDYDANASGNEVYNFSQDDYAMINYTGSLAVGTASPSGSNIPNGYIASGQGFFVIGKKSGVGSAGYINPVVFNNSMRETGNNNQFFRTSEQTQSNKLWIDLTSDNGIFNQVLVGYIDGATDAFDGMHYDALRNLSTGARSILYMSIPNTDKKFAIQGKEPSSLTLDEVIPLGFYTSIDIPTIYKLSIEQLEGDFLTNNTVYLKDNLLNLTHNLSTGDYTFTSEVGEFNNRFEIVFRDQALSVVDNEILASGLTIIDLPNGQVKFTVGNNLDIKAIEIIDMLGRTLYQLKGDSPVEVYDLNNLSQAAYIAKVILSNGQVITKRAVKRK